MAVRPFDEIFRDFVINGLPASGPHHPHKGDIRDSLNALVAGPFPDNRVIKLNNANEGTENNIVVSASVAIPTAVYQVLYVLNVTQENTGPVTVSGAINRALVTNTNEPVPAGYLKPGMAVLCIDTGSELRMLSYGDVESAVEELTLRAEAAEAAAELAKNQAQNAASDAVSQGNVPIYSTRNAVETLEIPAGINAFRTNGFASVGDGGTALYKKVDTEPSHAGKVMSADGAWWEVVPVNGEVDFAAFGGVDDNLKDNTVAWTEMRTYVNSFPATVVRIVERNTGIFLFSTPGFWIEDERFEVEGNVTLKGIGVTYRNNVEIQSGALRFVETTIQSEYVVPSLDTKRFRNLLSSGDLDQSEERHLPFTNMRPFQVVHGSGTVSSSTTGYDLGIRYMQFDAAAAVAAHSNKWFGALTPARAGRSYSWGFRPGSWNSAGVCIVTTSGIHLIYGRQANSEITHSYKEVDAPLVSKTYPSVENIGGFYTYSQLGYRFPWANVSVDVISPQEFIVCINGVAVTPPVRGSGIILEVGPVVYAVGSPSASSDTPIIVGTTERRNPIVPSFRARSVLYIGSSSTAPGIRSWPYHFEDEIYQSFGIQIARSKNIAVSGDWLSSQLARLQAEDFGPEPYRYTDIICFIGANNIQSQTNRAEFQSQLNAMIDIADAHNCTIMFILPQMFYNQADAIANGGLGGGTTNAQLHALYREYMNVVVAARRAAGSRVGTLDVDRIIGPVLAANLSYGERHLDRLVTDNIHINSYLRKNIGLAVARRLVGMLYPKSYSATLFPVSPKIASPQNGWSGSFSVQVSNNEVFLSGQLASGGTADGTVILVLPDGLRPSTTSRTPTVASGAPNAYLHVSANGNIAVYNATGATTVDLSCIRFALA